MRVLLSFVISLICLYSFGQNNEKPTMKSIEIQKITDFEIPNSILFIIKEDIQQLDNLFDLTTRLNKQFEETKIKIDSEFDFKDSEIKVVDRDIMILKSNDFDRNNFETEFVLDFTNLKTDHRLRFELKNKEDKILLNGFFEITEKQLNSEMNELISSRILELFE